MQPHEIQRRLNLGLTITAPALNRRRHTLPGWPYLLSAALGLSAIALLVSIFAQ